MSHNEGNLLYDLLRPIFCLQTIGTKLQIRLYESLIENVVYLLNDHKVNHFFSIRQIFHYFFTEVALSVSRMARLLFLLFVFDTSKNVLQKYNFFRTYANKSAKIFHFCIISISTQYFKGHILPKDYQSGNRCFGVSGSCLHETDGVKTDIFRRQPWQNVHNFPDHIRGNWAQSKVFFAFAQGRMPTFSKVTFAFSFKVAKAADSVVIKATDASAHPTNQQICRGPQR